MIKSILTISFTVLTSIVVLGQENNDNKRPDGPPSVKQILKDLDTNKDGKISFKEAKGPLKKDFNEIDTNEDGFISQKELKNAPKPKRREN
ncbi:EF-hand domain-containing protein [uncultured Polaribacter sp.]|uniref:EF-hand domain-containing protein n=1 Tax=uncultured Polaribacter sp. TaxID=174711 RepID=UPI0026319F21|nr:EF-hand domain-containing protein [uncultured Polaribacter sp.]